MLLFNCVCAISKAGSPPLRELLGHAMHAAVRFDPDLKAFYKRLARRRSRSIAKVAATRKLLIRLFIMLRDEIDYSEFYRRGWQPECPQRLRG